MATVRYRKDRDAEKVLAMLEGSIKEGVDFCERIHDRSEENNKYVRGHQWAEGDIDRQKEKERPALPLNSLIKVINAVANREIMDRIVPRAYGRSTEDNAIAEAMDEAMRWQRDVSETEHEESMAFRNCATSGYGVMHKWWDEMALDGAGMIRDEEIPIWYMLWDSRSRKQNLVDRRWHVCGKYVPISEAKELFGTVSKEAKALFRKLESENMFSRDKDPYVGPNVSGGRWGWSDVASGQWFLRQEQELFIVEYEWKESKRVWKASVPVRMDEAAAFVSGEIDAIDIGQTDEQGQPIPLTHQEYLQLDEQAQMNLVGLLMSQRQVVVLQSKDELEAIALQYEGLTNAEFEDYIPVLKENFRYAIASDGVLLDVGERPFGFTYEFMTGFPYEQKNGMEFFGMCDVAKGPQDMKNVFLSNMLALYMTSPKGNIMVEQGAVDNPGKFANTFAKPGGVQFVPDGFLQSGRWLQLQSGDFPPMLKELVEMTSNAVQEEFGLSSIEMGAQGDLRRITTNVVTAARQATNTILAILFDGLRRYRRRWGLLNLKFMQGLYSPEEIHRIIGPEVGQAITGMENWPEINRFDIKIDEAPTSVSEQLETVDFLTRTGTLDNWVNAGYMTFEDAIDLMVNIPQSTRDRIKANSQRQRQIQEHIQSLEGQLEQAKQKEVMWQSFLKTIPEGQSVISQFEIIWQLAQQMHSQMMQQAPQNQSGVPQG